MIVPVCKALKSNRATALTKLSTVHESYLEIWTVKLLSQTAETVYLDSKLKKKKFRVIDLSLYQCLNYSKITWWFWDWCGPSTHSQFLLQYELNIWVGYLQVQVSESVDATDFKEFQ